MSRPTVEFLEHTADLRARFRGPTLEKLLENACRALGGYLYGSAAPGGGGEVRVVVEGSDDLARFVAALNEALYLLQERRLRIREVFLRDETANWKLTFLADPAGAFPTTEIKAATFHEGILEREGDGWKAEITFDL
jgi:SHS2 domain-containing protein